jgi:outer membrane protein assembly factor BamA
MYEIVYYQRQMSLRVLVFTTWLLLAVLHIGAIADTNNPVSDSTSEEIPDSLKNSLTFLPAIFYTPETKLGFGIYPNYIFRFSRRCKPSNLAFLAFYTANKQVSLSLDPRLYFRDNQYILSGTVFYEKWPDSFFGFGTNVSKDDDEDFTTRNTGFRLDLKRRLFRNLYAGLSYELVDMNFLEIEEGGALALGEITGSDNGTNIGTGISITWENVDNTFFPSTGEYLELKSSFFGRTAGGDYTYKSLTVDMRKYHSLGSRNVLAYQLYADFIDGDAPFNFYSRIGQVVRGYLPTLYIEKKLIAAQVEYRHVPLWNRFGFTLFAGAGSVANTISDLQYSKSKFAAGFGIRYMLVESEKFNIRIDYGIGNDSAELYLAVGEAF